MKQCILDRTTHPSGAEGWRRLPKVHCQLQRTLGRASGWETVEPLVTKAILFLVYPKLSQKPEESFIVTACDLQLLKCQEGWIHIQNQTPFPPEMLRGLKQTLCTPGPKDSTETETELSLSTSCGGGQRLWLWIWHKSSWRRSPWTPPQSYQNLHRMENWFLEGTAEPCAPGPRRKEQWSHRRLACGCPEVSRKSLGWWWPAAGSGAQTVAVHVWNLLRVVITVFIKFTIVWPQVNSRDETHCTHQQKIGLKIYWAWSHPSEQDPVSPSVSLSHQEAFISLLSFSIRGETEWKTQSQKTNQSNNMDHSLF